MTGPVRLRALAGVIAVLSLGCGGKAQKGTGIKANEKCSTSNESVCASGLFCDVNRGDGREILVGNEYVVLGRCAPQRGSGESCTNDSWCAPPAKCVRGSTSTDRALGLPGSQPGYCTTP